MAIWAIKYGRLYLLSEDVTQHAQGRYRAQALDLLKRHGVHVFKWETSHCGRAWHAQQGIRPISCMHPTGPVAFAILAHEVGHHVRGGWYGPTWWCEMMAWDFAIEALDRYGVRVGPSVQKRILRGVTYHYKRAKARGAFHPTDEQRVVIARVLARCGMDVGEIETNLRAAA